MKSRIPHTLAILTVLAGLPLLPACQPNPVPVGPAIAGPGFGTIKGMVSVDGVISTGGGNVISTGGGNFVSTNTGNFTVLQARGVKGGKVKCVSNLDTREVDVAEDGSFSAVVKAGAEYTVEATVPDGKGGVFKSVQRVNVPLAQEPQVADIGSLVTRRTGSIQGLVQLAGATGTETPEGADVFLSGGTSVVGKVAESGRFALTNVPEGTWNLVVMKPGFGRQVVSAVQVRAGRPSMVEAAVVLQRDAGEAKAGIRGRVESSSGGAVVGATVSAFPKDRAMLAGSDAGLDNFTAISDDQGNFEMLNLPPGDYQVQVYRPFYQLPPRQSVTVAANTTNDTGAIKLQSTIAYFGKLSGQVLDAQGRPLDGAVVQLDPPVTEAQFSDAAGNFTLDRVMPGEYNMSISAGGFTTAVMPVRVENQQNFALRVGTVGLPAVVRGPVDFGDVIVEPDPDRTAPSPSPTPTPAPSATPTPAPVPATVKTYTIPTSTHVLWMDAQGGALHLTDTAGNVFKFTGDSVQKVINVGGYTMGMAIFDNKAYTNDGAANSGGLVKLNFPGFSGATKLRTASSFARPENVYLLAPFKVGNRAYFATGNWFGTQHETWPNSGPIHVVDAATDAVQTLGGSASQALNHTTPVIHAYVPGASNGASPDGHLFGVTTGFAGSQAQYVIWRLDEATQQFTRLVHNTETSVNGAYANASFAPVPRAIGDSIYYLDADRVIKRWRIQGSAAETVAAELPFTGAGQVVYAAANQLYVIGGADAMLYAYHLGNQSWRPIVPLPGGVANVHEWNGKLYGVTGGTKVYEVTHY